MIKTISSPQMKLKSSVQKEGKGIGIEDKLSNNNHPHPSQSRAYSFNRVRINIHYHTLVPCKHLPISCEGINLYRKVYHNDNGVKQIII